MSRQSLYTLSFKDVNVQIGDKNILENLWGIVKPGDMLAVMGPSGAGKSTLLNSIAGRCEIMSGEIRVNSNPITKLIRRKICYVTQHDVFFANLTLYQTLYYTAMLKLPDKMPRAQKLRRIDEVIKTLDLEKCRDTMVGDMFSPGLSGGEKKRLSIACQIMTDPKMMLMDEPTTGLDYAIAFKLMQTLKNYTLQSKKTVITTIHQPSSQIFHMFTNVLLISSGKVAYFGKTSRIVDFFNSVGLYCPANYNPADFIIEAVKESEEAEMKTITGAEQLRHKDEDWICQEDANEYTESPKQATTIENGEQNKDWDTFFDNNKRFPTGFWKQMTTLAMRNFTHSKSRIFSKLNLAQIVTLTVYCCIVWFQIPYSEEGVADKMGLIFFTLLYWSFHPIFDAVSSFPEEWGVISKERASGAYRLSSYYIAKSISESPQHVCMSLIWGVSVYWVCGCKPEAWNFILFVAVLLLQVLSSHSLGLFLGSLSRDFHFVLTITAIVVLTSMLIAGYYVRRMLPWLYWMRYLSYMTYPFQAVLTIEYGMGAQVACGPINSTVIEECLQNDTLYYSGEISLEKNNITLPFWLTILAILGCQALFRIAAYVVLRYFRDKKQKFTCCSGKKPAKPTHDLNTSASEPDRKKNGAVPKFSEHNGNGHISNASLDGHANKGFDDTADVTISMADIDNAEETGDATRL